MKYARIARFEGGEGNVDDRIEEIRNRMREGRNEGGPRVHAMMLVDRENNRGANLMICDTEEDLRQIDERMNSMDPPPGSGRRTSVELYEIAIDSDSLE